MLDLPSTSSQIVKRTRSSRSRSRTRVADSERTNAAGYDESRKDTKRLLCTLTRALSSSKELSILKSDANRSLDKQVNSDNVSIASLMIALLSKIMLGSFFKKSK